MAAGGGPVCPACEAEYDDYDSEGSDGGRTVMPYGGGGGAPSRGTGMAEVRAQSYGYVDPSTGAMYGVTNVQYRVAYAPGDRRLRRPG